MPAISYPGRWRRWHRSGRKGGKRGVVNCTPGKRVCPFQKTSQTLLFKYFRSQRHRVGTLATDQAYFVSSPGQRPANADHALVISQIVGNGKEYPGATHTPKTWSVLNGSSPRSSAIFLVQQVLHHRQNPLPALGRKLSTIASNSRGSFGAAKILCPGNAKIRVR